MAFLWGLIWVLAPFIGDAYQMPLAKMANYGILINAILFALNIIPILPWDGGIFIDTFLPVKYSQAFRKIEPYGTWIILLLMLTGILGAFIAPVVQLVMILVQSLIGWFI